MSGPCDNTVALRHSARRPAFIGVRPLMPEFANDKGYDRRSNRRIGGQACRQAFEGGAATRDAAELSGKES
jgi:hypothetical protein